MALAAMGSAAMALAGCTTVTTNTIVTPTQQTNSAAIAAGGPAGAGQLALARGPGATAAPGRPRAAPPHWPTLAQLGGPVAEEAQTYRSRLPFMDHSIPLPDGDWTVIARNVVENPAHQPVSLRIVLERNSGSVLTGLMVIGGNPPTVPFAHGLPLSPICSGGGAILADIRAAEPQGAQDCGTVISLRGIVLHDVRAAVFLRIAGNNLDARNITPPPVLVGTSFIVADRTRSLVGDVFFNPDQAGIAPDLSTQAAQSGWAAFNIDRDPRKKAYAQHVLRWSQGWRTALKQVLAGGRPGLPPDVAVTP